MFYCSSCGVPLRPGQTKCINCFQAFPHPVPDAVPDTEYRAHYWPPHQSSTAEDAVRRARTWWEGINNGKKAAVFGGLALVLIVCIVPHHGPGDLQPRVGEPRAYQNPQYVPPTQPPVAAAPPPLALGNTDTFTGGAVDRTGNGQPAPVPDPQPQYYPSPAYSYVNPLPSAPSPSANAYSISAWRQEKIRELNTELADAMRDRSDVKAQDTWSDQNGTTSSGDLSRIDDDNKKIAQAQQELADVQSQQSQ